MNKKTTRGGRQRDEKVPEGRGGEREMTRDKERDAASEINGGAKKREREEEGGVSGVRTSKLRGPRTPALAHNGWLPNDTLR